MRKIPKNYFKTQLNKIKNSKTSNDIIHLKRLISSVKNQLSFYQYNGLLGALNNQIRRLKIQ